MYQDNKQKLTLGKTNLHLTKSNATYHVTLKGSSFMLPHNSQYKL